ncbi:uncharacterized protein METZ01_LOCUS44817 [marine metagenome]|uniref:FlgD/Vpr Ig-like domain-containing protein n=1 Tax=marine metagenome TaxID=408172 RepID=A0A381RSU9_9ZZZZ
MHYGPGDGTTWWANSLEDVTTRACLFDDEYVFNADGSYNNVLGADTWLETWQGVDEGCGAPIAPHDGSNPATWTVDEAAGTITISGLGAFLGLAKVHNSGEDGAPVDNMITYNYSLYGDGNGMDVTVSGFNSGVPDAVWSFKFDKIQTANSVLSDFIAFTHPTEENTAFDHNLVLRHNGTVFPPLQNTDDTRDVLLHYKVLDYATVIADEVPFTQQELNLIDEEWGEHEYTVVAMYDEGASNPSNVVSVNLFNNPPSAVSLVAPPDNTTITITPDNVGTGVTMGIWTPAADPDNDPLLYTLYGNFDYLGQEAYWDSSTSATSLTITHAYWAAFMMTEGQEVDELTFAWSVQASDGTDTTHAGNGPRTLIVNVNAMYMDVDGDNIPDEFALYDNYPNPFNPVTSINYDIPEATDVTLDVYNLMGQRVRTLVSRHHEPGRYSVVWDGTNDFGSPIASGMYIFKIQSKDFMSIKKMLLMK